MSGSRSVAIKRDSDAELDIVLPTCRGKELLPDDHDLHHEDVRVGV